MNLDYEKYGHCYLNALFVQDTRNQTNDEFCDILYEPQFEKMNYSDKTYVKEDYLKIIRIEKVCILPDPCYCNGEYAKEQKQKHRQEHGLK